MDEHEDSPFQNIKQESPFQAPMHSIADQASFAESQMQKFRPESAPLLGPQQDESAFQPEGNGEPEEAGVPGILKTDSVSCNLSNNSCATDLN